MRIRVVFLAGLVVAPAVLLAAPEQTATLQQFETAVKQTGCATIPYPDLLESCIKKHESQVTICNKPSSCLPAKIKPLRDAINVQVDAKTADIAAVEKSKKTKRDQINDLQAKPGNVEKIKQIEARIAEDDKRIAALDKERYEIKMSMITRLDERRALAVDCQNARAQVQDKFNKARERAKDEEDVKIVPLAKQLIDKYEASSNAHDTANKDVHENIDRCDPEKNAASSNLDDYLKQK